MVFSIIIILILFIILIQILTNNQIIEGYDARYIDTSFSDCAKLCKTTANCSSFGYDKEKHICYPSQLSISGKPLESLFKDEYLYSNATCNKVKTIDAPNPKPPFSDRRSNSVYICSESYDKQPQHYFHNKNSFKNIGDGRNIDDIFDVEAYPVKPYTWPRNRFDYDQSDLLIKQIENETYNKNNITNLDRIVKYKPPIKKKEKRILPPRINIKPTLDFNLQRAVDNLYNSITNITQKVTAPIQADTTPKSIHKISDVQDVSKYKIYTDFNNGEYLNDNKCTKDIPLDDCLQYCLDSKLCKGIEWNPSYKKNKNVCCPYRTIDKFTPRNNDTKLGSFFVKL